VQCGNIQKKIKKRHNKALHLTVISLRSIVAGELGLSIAYETKITGEYEYFRNK